MYEKLEHRLNLWVSPERKQMIMAGLHILDKYNCPDAWTEMSQYLDYATDDPLATIIDSIETMITVGLNKVILAHGIVYTGSLSDKTLLLEGLLILCDNEDGERIVELATDPIDPNHALAELLSHATTKTWAMFIEHIQTVSGDFFKSLVSLYTPKDGGDDTEQGELTDSRKNMIKTFFDNCPSVMAKAVIVEELIPVGTPLELLINNRKLALGLLEPLAPEQAGHEILGLTMISDIEDKDIVKVAKENLDLIFVDLSFIAKADSAIDNAFAKVTQNA